MAEHRDTNPDMAAARIIAIRNAARQMSILTGGDKAEAAFELICAAILIFHESRPMKLPAELVADVSPAAAAVVEGWFPDELKSFRCRHG